MTLATGVYTISVNASSFAFALAMGVIESEEGREAPSFKVT